MLNLDTLLGRFRKSLGKNLLAKEAIIESVEASTGIHLNPDEINIKEFTLEIRSSPLKKNEIKLHEEAILAQIRAKTNQNINKVFYK
jgi:hypothetical protein